MNMPLALLNRRRRGGASFEKTLFSVPGSRGFFYDFSDYSTQFTDTAGTTPVTGVGQSLALVLDESQGLTRGPNVAVNGDFSSGTANWSSQLGATLTAISGGMRVTGQAATAFSLAFQTVTASLSTALEITWTATIETAGSTLPSVGIGAAVRQFSASGTYTMIAQGGRANNKVDLNPGTDGVVLFDNISVRELPGNHATQATAGSRALTQVRPMFTQRNFAGGSELPENNFYWVTSSTANGVTFTRVATGIDTDGLPYADYSVVGTATANSFFEAQFATTQRIPATTGQTWTVSMIARRLSGAAPAAGDGVIPYIRGETAPDTITETSTLAYNPANTETTLSTTFTLANAATNQIRSAVSFRVSTGSTANYVVRVKAFQLELGSTRTPYQVAVSGELRNRAIGSGAVGNATYWPNTSTVNGVTSTKVASGFDADGLPYVDVRYQGTATSTFHDGAYSSIFSRAPATASQPWTVMATARRIAGSTTGVVGFAVSVVEENIPPVFVGSTAPAGTTATVDVFLTATRTIASGNQARVGAVLEFNNGAAIDVTYRIKGLQLEQGATYSRYQRTITANEWYEPGFTSYRGIRFDGSDDFLQTAAIDFSNSDKMTVVAGVRKLSDAATGTVVELSVNPDTTNGSFGMRAPAGANSYVFRAFGTVGPVAVPLTGFAAPESAVITGSGDISADSTVIRRNGAAGASLGTDLGTGNYSNSPAFIGRGFGGTTSPFNGVLTFLCVINRTLTAAELAQLEAFANSRTGAY